jgi:hypothetical protein
LVLPIANALNPQIFRRAMPMQISVAKDKFVLLTDRSAI